MEGKSSDTLSAARLAAPGGHVVESTEASLESMKQYAKNSRCSEVLQELYEKVVIDQPDDVVEFLIRVLKARSSPTAP